MLIEDDRAYLVGVYTQPEHRGTGLAAQLFEAAVEWSWAQSEVRNIRLHVHRDNPRAAAFYRRQGFRVITGPDPEKPDCPEYEMELVRPSCRGFRDGRRP
ncbi:GNAT family N-acetyltransferase [Streptomyces carminius]|uniref:GNAT family N-acetyltransferase n=1 Tax=Streptomyces carminius TaxID=2665496 RepID=UPI001E3CCEAD|nr:GNAT family N-acetyltransferase [Streptomyces carminius]